MSLNPVSISTNTTLVNDKNRQKRSNQPNFKGLGMVIANAPSAVSALIEKGGFVTSFLVQDTLGMTAPRSKEGFYRNREKGTKFKDLNFKEGLEVFIREFLSGILMMLAPFAAFALTKKFAGKTTFMHTDMIKNLGKGLTETVNAKKATDTAKDVKSGFYKNIITKMVKGSNPTVADEALHTNTINSIHGHVEKLDELEKSLADAKGNGLWTSFTNLFKSKENKVVSPKKQIKTQIADTKSKIVEELNNYHKTHSSDMELVNHVKIGDDTFRITDTIDGMLGFMQDASKKNLAEYTEESAKKFQTTSMTKRVLSTVGAAAATIGATSIVPKIYTLLNPVSPGISEGTDSKPHFNFNKKHNESAQNSEKKPISFKGNILKQLQFDGNQLTPLLMSGLAAGGLIVPRVNTAIKRAPVEENGEKNLIEVPEILTRDIVSTGTVVFAVPMLTKGIVGSYQKKSGFVLMNDKKDIPTYKKVLDVLNPLSPVSTYSTGDLKEIYGNIDTKAKFKNFAAFINEKDGHLAKVLEPLPEAQSMFESANLDLKKLAKVDRKEANSKIIDVIANHFDDVKSKKLFAPKQGHEFNEMFLKARRLSGTPKAIATLCLVPYFLGFVLPKFVYKITAQNKAKHEQKIAEYRRNKMANAQSAPQVAMHTVDAFNKIKTHKA